MNNLILKKIIKHLILSVCLCRLCVTDIKKRELENIWILALLFAAPFSDVLLRQRLAGMVIGLLLFKFLAPGDIYLISTLGFTLGISSIVRILCYASIAAGIYSAALLALKKRSLKDSIPFAPFIFTGLICLMGEFIKSFF